MSLDPHSLALLETFRQAGGTAIDDIDMASARRDYDALFSQLGGPLADRVTIRQHGLAMSGHDLPLRLYTPDGGRGRRPTLLFFHGGGWSMGGLACYDAPLSHLAARSGCLVVSVGYRLAPEHPFPAPLEDALNATRWALAEIAVHGGDPDRLILAGDSAGGNLAAATCHLLVKAPKRPKAQLLFYPVMTLVEGDQRLVSRQKFGDGDYFLSRAGIAWARKNYLPDASLSVLPAVSPLLAPDLAGLPPTLVVTGGHDPLRDEGALYVGRLKDAGAVAEHADFPGTFHGFLSFAGQLPVAYEAIDRAAAWIARTV